MRRIIAGSRNDRNCATRIRYNSTTDKINPRGKALELRFYRVDAGRSRRDGGAGLGLAIVKWVVQAHDGSITLESAPGAGCVFRLDLPPAAGTPV